MLILGPRSSYEDILVLHGPKPSSSMLRGSKLQILVLKIETKQCQFFLICFRHVGTLLVWVRSLLAYHFIDF